MPPKNHPGRMPHNMAEEPSDLASSEALLLHEGVMESPRLVSFEFGSGAIFSSRSPAKQTPNEDSAGLIAIGDSGAILAVADGVGGYAAGEVASRVAIKSLLEATRNLHQTTSLREAILDAFEKANHAIIDLGQGSATTLAVAEVDRTSLRSYHAGDAGVLVTGLRGRIKHQTLAHGPVAYAVESGMLDEHDAMHHDDRSLISNLLGSSDMRIELGPTVQLATRDTVLVCSDGVADNLTTKEIVALIRKGPLDEAAQALADACRKRMTEPEPSAPSAPDDCSFVLFRLHA
ncbi:MAG: serine/threonine-protein phosphatase [Phycisphaeraceae bacterium]|nr:MAG: serine/threonine-protein phosphatase [Phycisphaeraceae bacterium]